MIMVKDEFCYFIFFSIAIKMKPEKAEQPVAKYCCSGLLSSLLILGLP